MSTAPTKQLRAVGYCRTSGEGQRDNTSIPNQKESIQAFVERNGWKFLHHYVDVSKSGSKVEGRIDFQKMLKDAALDQFDVIVVFDVTRFARDGVDILGTSKFLSQNFNVHVVDTKGQFNSRPDGNVLMNYVHAGSSEVEKISIMDRTIKGRMSNLRKGLPWSGNKPFGRDYVDGKWIVTPRGLRMRALLTRYAAGEGMTELLKEFTDFSSANFVWNVVRNSKLSGPYVKKTNLPAIGIVDAEDVVEGMPEIVTPELMERVQALKDHHTRFNRVDCHTYHLTGFVRCGHCDKALTGNTVERPTKDAVYYRHCSNPKAKVKKCVFGGIPGEYLVEPVLDYLYRFATDEPTFHAAVAKGMPSDDERAAAAQEKTEAQKAFDEVEKKIAYIGNAIALGGDPSLLIRTQTELKLELERCVTRLKIAVELDKAMPDRETLKQQEEWARIEILGKIQERDWRTQSHDEIKRFLMFLFGENPAKSGHGIIVTQERIHRRTRWRVRLKAEVDFVHDIVDGRPVSHLVQIEVASHNQWLRTALAERIKGIRQKRVNLTRQT